MRAFLLAVCLSVLASGCRRPEPAVEEVAAEPLVPGAAAQPFSGKAQVQVDIQNGFKENEVTVYVDGQRRFSKKITTNQTTGLAERLEFEWKKPEFMLGIALENEKKEWRCRVNLKDGIHLGVSRLEGRIHVQQSSFPFGYM